MMKKGELKQDEYPEYFSKYLSQVDDVDLVEELEISLAEFIRFVQNVPLGKHDYIYAPGKWTLKDIILHITDAERIFAYRALRIARNDTTPLPGFEENHYADDADANNRHLQDLLTEFSTVRYATMSLFRSLSDEKLKRMGTASGKTVSARAIGFTIIGHMKHHQKVFQERYL